MVKSPYDLFGDIIEGLNLSPFFDSELNLNQRGMLHRTLFSVGSTNFDFAKEKGIYQNTNYILTDSKFKLGVIIDNYVCWLSKQNQIVLCPFYLVTTCSRIGNLYFITKNESTVPVFKVIKTLNERSELSQLTGLAHVYASKSEYLAIP